MEDCSEDEKEQCSLHNKYHEIRTNLMNLFQNEKISELIDEIQEEKKTANL